MTKKYDYSVLIGRFQPPHKAHIEIIKQALEFSQSILIVVGSANAALNIKNPFTHNERDEMIRASLEDVGVASSRYKIAFVSDQLYSLNGWITDVQQLIRENTQGSVCLAGHHKDSSSYYLDVFKEYDFVEIGNVQDNLSSTSIREGLFEHRLVYDALPDAVKRFLYDWVTTEEYERLRDEWSFIKKYNERWNIAPYPPTFVTTDAVVVQSGHVLLVKRRAQPGRGLWALPGGFLDPNELILDGIVRELKEETKIKLAARTLKDKIKRVQVFDAPNRSLRGRTVTHAGLIQLDDTADLPKVKGSDDAEVAAWFPLSQIEPSFMYEDHYDIIKAMTGGL
ncbi:MAG: bifunctional nicotinamide-nucleotide adenylyltransferase/Nudix hydroxylase [Chromatiales bacterium]|nr:bifunctional nicotinamide-nucleotide adenylyltransferase/Nudix hydroxylase [Chromatiales bacterium]